MLTSRGSTAFHAFTVFGLAASAGNSFRCRAPARTAVNASVGVNTPGSATIPCSTARAMTSGLQSGDTEICPPADFNWSTLSTPSTVPAPTTMRPLKRAARAAMDWKGPGELSGTSTTRIPAS